MWNTPTEEELARIPKLYETENIPSMIRSSTCIFLLVAVTGTSLSMTARIFFGAMPS